MTPPRATNKDIHYFDSKLFQEIYAQNEEHTIRGSLSNIAMHMRNKFPKEFPYCDRYEVDRALERLENGGRIKRWVENRTTYTKALEQTFFDVDVAQTFFVDEKPVPVSQQAIKLYTHLIENRYIGKAHRISMKQAAKIIDTDERQTRKIVERINNNGYSFPPNMQPFEFLIMGNTDPKHSGYYIISNDDEMREYIKRYDHIIFKASRKARLAREKWGKDQQMQHKLKDIETDLQYFHDLEITNELRQEKHIANEVKDMPYGYPVDKDNMENGTKIIYYDDKGNPLPF